MVFFNNSNNLEFKRFSNESKKPIPFWKDNNNPMHVLIVLQM